MKLAKLVLALGLAPLVSLMGSPAWAGVLEGSVRYRERIALPPGASLSVELQDVSRADAPAEVVTRTVVEPTGQVPLPFVLSYDDAAIQPGRRYSLRATIRHQGRLLFTTDRLVPVLNDSSGHRALQLQIVAVPVQAQQQAEGLGALPATYRGELPGAGGPIRWHLELLAAGHYQLRLDYLNQSAPNRFDDIGRWTLESGSGRLVLRGGREAPVFLQVVEAGRALRKLDLQGQPIPSSHNDRLKRLARPAPIEPRLHLNGLFTYLADAPSIRLCLTGQRLPVAMEGDYRALEAAYLKARRQPGEPVLVGVEGLITTRPSLEPANPPEPTLVVKRFVGAWPRQSCSQALVQAPLRGTDWKLLRLGESAVTAAANQRHAHLRLSTEGLGSGTGTVSGSGGCNRLIGGFRQNGPELRFGRLGATQMACPEGMAQEQRFLLALEQVRSFRIRGSHLELFDAKGAVLARMEAAAAAGTVTNGTAAPGPISPGETPVPPGSDPGPPAAPL